MDYYYLYVRILVKLVYFCEAILILSLFCKFTVCVANICRVH